MNVPEIVGSTKSLLLGRMRDNIPLSPSLSREGRGRKFNRAGRPRFHHVWRAHLRHSNRQRWTKLPDWFLIQNSLSPGGRGMGRGGGGFISYSGWRTAPANGAPTSPCSCHWPSETGNISARLLYRLLRYQTPQGYRLRRCHRPWASTWSWTCTSQTLRPDSPQATGG